VFVRIRAANVKDHSKKLAFKVEAPLGNSGLTNRIVCDTAGKGVITTAHWFKVWFGPRVQVGINRGYTYTSYTMRRKSPCCGDLDHFAIDFDCRPYNAYTLTRDLPSANFSLARQGVQIASYTVKTVGSTPEISIEILPDEDILLALACALVIEATWRVVFHHRRPTTQGRG
jgi:hypothetical protein